MTWIAPILTATIMEESVSPPKKTLTTTDTKRTKEFFKDSLNAGGFDWLSFWILPAVHPSVAPLNKQDSSHSMH
jgi:hypothetical protein